MRQLLHRDEVDLWLSCIKRPYHFVSPFRGSDFALLLVVLDPEINLEERTGVSREIIRENCRYAVCFGVDCSRWDDSIDWVHLETDDSYNPPDDRLVMTTWHEEEPLDEVVKWFRWATTFDSFIPGKFLVCLIGGKETDTMEVERVVTEQFGDER